MLESSSFSAGPCIVYHFSPELTLASGATALGSVRAQASLNQTDVMKQVTPSNREHYTHGCWLKNKEGVTMSIYFGVDFHARQQFIKWCDTSDGEVHEQQLFHHALEEVREFYTR